jgi:hypothetical protein
LPPANQKGRSHEISIPAFQAFPLFPRPRSQLPQARLEGIYRRARRRNAFAKAFRPHAMAFQAS